MARGDGVKKLGDLFAVYKKRLVAPEGSVKSAFVEVVEDLTGLVVDQKKVSYTPYNRTINLSVSGPLKTEIKMRETEILAHLKGRLGEKNAPRHIVA